LEKILGEPESGIRGNAGFDQNRPIRRMVDTFKGTGSSPGMIRMRIAKGARFRQADAVNLSR